MDPRQTKVHSWTQAGLLGCLSWNLCHGHGWPLLGGLGWRVHWGRGARTSRRALSSWPLCLRQPALQGWGPVLPVTLPCPAGFRVTCGPACFRSPRPKCVRCTFQTSCPQGVSAARSALSPTTSRGGSCSGRPALSSGSPVGGTGAGRGEHTRPCRGARRGSGSCLGRAVRGCVPHPQVGGAAGFPNTQEDCLKQKRKCLLL